MGKTGFLLALVTFLSNGFTGITDAAAGSDEAVMLVATRELAGSPFEASVLIVRSLPNGGHVGFIVNKPTASPLSAVLPVSEASKKLTGPLFIGGPANANALFAIVERHSGTKDGALPITSDLFLAMRVQDMDGIIASESEHARFFVGMVRWNPGELEEEMEDGLWYTQAPDAKLVLRKDTTRLWEELVRREENLASAI
jgi:putative transcriptional regulator